MSAHGGEMANNNNSYESSASLSPGTTASSAGGGGPSVSYVLAKDGRNAELKELRSDDGRFRFVVEDSGSVVLYRESDAIWAVYSGLAAGNPRSLDRVKMVLQSDGDLIVLHDRLGLIFSSGTSVGSYPGEEKAVQYRRLIDTLKQSAAFSHRCLSFPLHMDVIITGEWRNDRNMNLTSDLSLGFG